MWMLPLRLGGFDGGILHPMSKPKTSSPLLFLFARKSSKIGFTKLPFGHRYSNTLLRIVGLDVYVCMCTS